MPKKDMVVVEGTVVEELGNIQFRVKLNENHSVIAYASGKLRMNNISLILGSVVTVELSPYDLTKGRIVRRLK